jgi:hypothetical protein
MCHSGQYTRYFSFHPLPQFFITRAGSARNINQAINNKYDQTTRMGIVMEITEKIGHKLLLANGVTGLA